MFAKLALLVACLPMTFTMCGQHGKVPQGCCRHGDTLNVILLPQKDPTTNNFQERCDQMGGKLIVEGDDVMVCHDVDF